MHVHKGSAAHARTYVEADRHLCGDYYLAEGEGIAERLIASRDRTVIAAGPLDGEQYERWVAGFDPATGQPKGRLRSDDRANRFQEITINGPKSWSLAAALVPELAAAYDAAQERAATQVVGWLGEHLTYRVGRRGEQVQAPVDQIEAVMVRHHTSRAGDPHRHIHLQVNARVWGAGAWRGLHTVGFRDSLAAMNGIGHAAMMTDPEFREALAKWGFTLDPATGEIEQLGPYVGAFSARTAQVARNIERYEAAWRADHAGSEPPAALRRQWDAMAWADGRPQKKLAGESTAQAAKWVEHLHELGFTMPRYGATVDATPAGRLDRDDAARVVLARLAAKASRWNAADARGQAERLIAELNIVVPAAARLDLTEDITARAVAACVSLVDGVEIESHVRHLTSPHVIAVEDELTRRIAARSQEPTDEEHAVRAIVTETTQRHAPDLDAGQLQAVGAIVSGPQLVVIEGAAGAGKTTLLAAAKEGLEREYRHLTVVTPTRKAARVAAEQTGAAATSAAWLAHQHGFRWDDNGQWTRLRPGQTDPMTGRVYDGPSREAWLRPRSTLLIDEAGMLDQDTALALMTIADESRLRVVFVGDRHQLPAVGRGGVLDHAVRWVDPNGYVPLDAVHRFQDPDYADITLKMRSGERPAEVFDQLVQRDGIATHTDDHQRTSAIVSAVVRGLTAGREVVVAADTRAQVLELNVAIRNALVQAGAVDSNDEVLLAGGPVSVGDKVVSRRNDTNLGVANRDSWIVSAVHDDQSLSVIGTRGQRHLPAEYVREHVELGYATTVHGAQGDTVDEAHFVLSDTTGAAAAYVGMTRGRHANTAHLVSESLSGARDQWVCTFARDRADLGPAAATKRAYEDAARNAALRRSTEHIRHPSEPPTSYRAAPAQRPGPRR